MVNKQVLLIAPIIFLFTISMFSLMGLSNGELGEGYSYTGFIQDKYFYDAVGRPIIYTANFTHVSEDIHVRIGDNTNIDNKPYAVFTNTTGLVFLIPKYYIYPTSDGESGGEPILWEDFGNVQKQILDSEFFNLTADFNSSYGVISLFIALMVAIGLAGIHFLGIGESETSLQTIFMGVGFIAVWVIFSIISLNLLATIPYGIGAVFYFGLTVSYILGLILNIGKG